jgi:hypothetical protein
MDMEDETIVTVKDDKIITIEKAHPASGEAVREEKIQGCGCVCASNTMYTPITAASAAKRLARIYTK